MPSGAVLALETRTDTWRRESAQWLLEGVTELLGAGSRPRMVGAAPIGARRQRRLLDAHADGWRARPPADTVTELLAQTTARCGSAVAVIEDGGRVLTYRQLDREADSIAAVLRRQGAGSDDVVGVIGHRSASLVAALIGVLKAGAAFLALDPQAPADRTSFMIRDSGTRLLLRLPGDTPSGHPEPTVDVVRPDGGSDAGRTVTGPAGAAADRLAYVVYTSGSSGCPKGILVEHRSLANQLWWQHQELPLGPAARVAFKSPIGFDASLSEVFGPLTCGATVVVAAPNGERDAGYLIDLCREHAISSLALTPSQLDAVLWHPRFDGLPSVRRIAAGGEELRPSTARRCLDTTAAELVNLYGPSEATINSTFHRLEPSSSRDDVPIGLPVANTSVRVLDDELRPAPFEVVGEICIGGVQLARRLHPRCRRRRSRPVHDGPVRQWEANLPNR